MNHPDITTISGEPSRQLTSYNPKTRQKTITIAPNESRTIAQSDGCGVINRIWLTFPGWFWRHWDTEAQNDPTVLRLTILKIYFDGCDQPSVVAPIGDFFGIGHCEYRHYTSQYLGMSSGGFYCYFPMPYQHGFRFEVANLHPTLKIDLFFNINLTVSQELAEDIGRFHASFHCGRREGCDELEILNVTGKGHYVGCSLSIQGEPLQYLSYLEAPEFMEIDGDDALRICGTGMEDYFNGGWYFRNGEFFCETHGIPLKDTLRSMTSMYRFHDRDRVNFLKSFRMTFLNPWEKERLRPVIYSSVGYCYTQTAAPAAPIPSSAEELTRLYRRRDVDFQSVP